MRVLHIGKYFPPYYGGMETFLQDLCFAQVESGLTVEALVHNERGRKNLYETIPLDGGELSLVRVGTLGRLLFTPLSPSFPLVLKDRLAKFRPDILHLHMPNPSIFWLMLLAGAGDVPWVVHWHSDVVSSQLDWRVRLAYRFYRPFEQAILRRASRIVATSQDYLDSSEPLRPWRGKCEVIPLGMAGSRLSQPGDKAPPGAKFKWKNGKLRVLAVGRLTYYKGFEYLVRAGAMSKDVHIAIAGEGDGRSSLQQLIQNLGCEEQVQLLGRQSDTELAVLMSGCDCLCLPSIERTEAFGMVLLEAMSFAKPVVVSRVPGSGMGWVAQDGETGLAVAPADHVALADAFARLGSDRGELARMGEQARSRFDRVFRIERITQQITELYRRMRYVPSGAGSDA